MDEEAHYRDEETEREEWLWREVHVPFQYYPKGNDKKIENTK